MTQADYAKYRKVGRSAVSNWKRDGLLVFVEDPASGKPRIDVARTDARVNAAIDPHRGRPTSAQAGAAIAPADVPAPGPQPADDLANVRTDLIRAQTVEKNLKNARTAGELVLLSDFEARASDYGRLIRERLHAIAREKSEQLAAERDPRAVVSILGTEFDTLLTDLGRRIVNAPAQVPDDETKLDAEMEGSDETLTA